MVYQIVWTGKAEESYGHIIDYLQKEWTEKEISKLMLATEQKLSRLLHHPYLGSAASRNNREIRCTIINKRISLIYRGLCLSRRELNSFSFGILTRTLKS
jgi:plasmid stabilization system protein ParE